MYLKSFAGAEMLGKSSVLRPESDKYIKSPTYSLVIKKGRRLLSALSFRMIQYPPGARQRPEVSMW